MLVRVETATVVAGELWGRKTVFHRHRHTRRRPGTSVWPSTVHRRRPCKPPALVTPVTKEQPDVISPPQRAVARRAAAAGGKEAQPRRPAPAAFTQIPQPPTGPPLPQVNQRRRLSQLLPRHRHRSKAKRWSSPLLRPPVALERHRLPRSHPRAATRLMPMPTTCCHWASTARSARKFAP